jgi:YVTN family beta-propeller protein
MIRKTRERALLCASLASTFIASLTLPAGAAHMYEQAAVGGGPAGPALLPNGQYISALVTPGATFQRLYTGLRPDYTADANGATTTTLSPDGKTLLVLTSGYNANFSTPQNAPIRIPFLNPLTGQPSLTTTTSFQWVFVYNVTNSSQPQRLQQIALPSTFEGVAWDPSGTKFYVSGGQDDRVYAYKKTGTSYIPDAPFAVLMHNSDAHAPQPKYDGGLLAKTLAGKTAGFQALGLGYGAETAGVAVSADGTTIYAANIQNDSVSIIDAKTRAVISEFKTFTPGSAVPKGEYPYWVTPHASANGSTDKLYVSSLRDGQVISLSTSGAQGVIGLGGKPMKMLLSRDGSRLYVANPDLDEIDEITTATDTLTRRISVKRPGYVYRGASPNSLALTANGATLYVTLGGENAVAVIDVARGSVLGRIPTGWFPTSVTISADGAKLYVVNTKSNSGPNLARPKTTAYGLSTNPSHINEYVYALEKAGILTVPIPDRTTLSYLSAIVDANNNFYRPRSNAKMAFLRTKIKHVIYIEKENRTYDQVLGDLGRGNGEPRLALFGESITPNLHAIARQFSDIDNYYDSGDVSGDGWNWTIQGHANDYTAKYIPINYAGNGFTYDANGDIRGINLASPLFGGNQFNPERVTTLLDPTGKSTILPGSQDPSANEGADDDSPKQTGGYLWDTVLRAGLSVRHYGFYDDQTFYTPGAPGYLPIVRNAFAARAIQGLATKLALKSRTDPYYRGWDLNVPDEYRYEEWKREFDGYVKNGDLPSLEVLTIMMNHTGAYSSNVAHLNTPELDQSSNDHAVGELVDAVSHSKYWASTAIFITEDDAQDGPDHVDSHRSTAFVISPWVAHNSVVNTNYNTDSMLHTMEDILGVNYLGFNDANAESMSDVFATQPELQPYDVIIPGALCQPPVDPALVPTCYDPNARKSKAYRSLHAGAWWEAQSKANHLVWNGPDKNDAATYNRLLWKGVVGNQAYPDAVDTATPGADSGDSE